MSATITPEVMIRHNRDLAETRKRMANDAAKQGIRIVIIVNSDRHLAVHTNHPVAYPVSTQECSCRMFAIFGKCYHHALLCAELGDGAMPDDIGWPEDHDHQHALLEPWMWDQRPSAMVAD
jgi:hypothetical protein